MHPTTKTKILLCLPTNDPSDSDSETQEPSPAPPEFLANMTSSFNSLIAERDNKEKKLLAEIAGLKR